MARAKSRCAKQALKGLDIEMQTKRDIRGDCEASSRLIICLSGVEDLKGSKYDEKTWKNPSTFPIEDCTKVATDCKTDCVRKLISIRRCNP